jgi:hypothetical protein
MELLFTAPVDFEIQIKKGNERHNCKHVRAIVLAESYGLITTRQFSQPLTKFEEVRESKSYLDDDYSC